MIRIVSVCLCCLILCGCGTYVRRPVQHDDGTIIVYPYAYGKFCGPGHPRQAPTQIDIQNLWPPIDDMDALCYAHDQCFRANATSQVGCDSVLLAMLIKSQSAYRAKGCWNDATNMTIAFFAKPWGKGHNRIDTYSDRVAQTLVSIPTGLFWAAIKAPLLPFLKNSEEGTCNISESSRPDEVVEEFLEIYNLESLSQGRPSIEIPIGDRKEDQQH